jgi:hypothetical protein
VEQVLVVLGASLKTKDQRMMFVLLLVLAKK